MEVTPLEVDALQSAAKAIPFVAKRLYSHAQLKKLATGAEAKLVTPDPEFIDKLAPEQLVALKSLIVSPVFSHLALQALIFRLGNMSDTQAEALRDHVRATIQHTGLYSQLDLYQATDLLLDLINRCVNAIVISASPSALNRDHAVKIAAEVAASMARNSSLLQQLNTLTDINNFGEALRTQTRLMHTKINTSHLSKAGGIDYTNLYITPNIIANGEAIELNHLAAQYPRTVILGDPGAGKSTLATRLARDLSEDNVPDLEGQVPLLLVVRQHTQVIRSENNTLLHYLEAACRQPYNIDPTPHALDYLLLNGCCTVIIDGIDELGDSRYRKVFTELVNGFAHRYPLARVIVTSRIIGYKDAPLDAELFPAANISPFTLGQVKQYAQRWFRLDTSISAGEESGWVDSFMTQSEQAKDLRANPLVLSLLCALFRTRHSLPRNKPEIYEECAKLLFDMWDRQRGIDAAYHFAAHIRPAVQQIAWLMFTDRSGRQALPRSELQDFLAEYMLLRRFPDPNDAIQAADDFLDFWAGRAWVLTDLGADALQPHYGFVHRTFLEFFAATQLVKHDPHADAVWKQLREHISAGEWDVVSQLAVQILDRSCDDGADQLLRLVIDEANTCLTKDQHRKNALLDFAARTFDNVAPTNALLTKVVTEATRTACLVPAARRRMLGPSRNSINEDAVLEAILKCQNPDNVDRLARIAAATLVELAEGERESFSAGLIYAAIWELQLYSPAANLIHKVLRGLEIPTAATNWHSLLFAPNAADIRHHGLMHLYQHSEVCGFRVPSVVSKVVSARFSEQSSNNVTSAKRFLEDSYEAILAAWPPTLAVRELDSDLAKGICGFRSADLKALSARSKGTFLLLLAPVLPIFAESQHASDATLFVKQLTSLAGRDPSSARESDAVELLNSWNLPCDVYNKLIRYFRLSG